MPDDFDSTIESQIARWADSRRTPGRGEGSGRAQSGVPGAPRLANGALNGVRKPSGNGHTLNGVNGIGAAVSGIPVAAALASSMGVRPAHPVGQSRRDRDVPRGPRVAMAGPSAPSHALTWISEHRVTLLFWALAVLVMLMPGLNHFWPR